MMEFPRRALLGGAAGLALGGTPLGAQALRHDLLIRGGEVVDPSQNLRGRRDVAIRNGLVVAVEPEIPAEAALQGSLRDFVTERAREIDPEIWFVEDHEPGLPGQTRGVLIAGVSPHASIPVALRTESDERAKEWRTRLALEMIDAVRRYLSSSSTVITVSRVGVS